MRSLRSPPSYRAATGGWRRVFAPRPWLGGAFAALVAIGCVTDHHELAEQPGSGGAPGYGGDAASHAGAAGKPEHDSGTIVLGDGGGGDAGQSGPPSGPVVVTLLNGVTDSPWIGFCFAAVHGGKPAPLSGEITPPGGIEYARSATVTSVSGALLGTDDLLPFVVAARGADVVSGVDCRQILARATQASDDHGASDGSAPEAGAVERDAALSLQDATTLLDGDSGGGSPPGPEPVPPVADVRVTELPVIPAAAFLEARSFLLALGGCLGGQGVTDPSEKSVCGEQYTPNTPTLSVGILKLPHGAPKDHVGLSFLGGTPAVKLITTVDLSPGESLNPYAFAKSIPAGGVRPAPPDLTHTVSDLGADAMGSIEVFADANPAPIYAERWQTTFAASGVASIENGHDYTLVLVGPYPGFSRNKWWNEPVVTIVDSEP